MMAFQQLHQIGRGSRFEPVTAEFHFGKSIEQAEGIVYSYCVLREMITVIACFQFPAHFVIGHVLASAQFVQLFLKAGMYFLFCYSTYLDVSVIHRNIVQIIQITEYAHFTKFGYSCQQGETDILIHTFHNPVECFQRLPIFFLQVFVAYGLQHGFIVFIYQDHYTLPCLFVCQTDEGEESVIDAAVGIR